MRGGADVVDAHHARRRWPSPRWRWRASPRGGRRAAAGAVGAVGVAEQAAEEPLAARADEHRVARWRRSASRWASSVRLWACGLAEPDARVDPHLGHAGGARPRRPARPGRRAPRRRRRRSGGRPASWRARPACAWRPRPRRARRPRAPLARADVVEQRGPGGDRGPGHRRLAGVDRHPGALGGQRLDHGHDPAQLLGLRRPARRRAGWTRRRRRASRRPRRAGPGRGRPPRRGR